MATSNWVAWLKLDVEIHHLLQRYFDYIYYTETEAPYEDRDRLYANAKVIYDMASQNAVDFKRLTGHAWHSKVDTKGKSKQQILDDLQVYYIRNSHLSEQYNKANNDEQRPSRIKKGTLSRTPGTG